MSTILFFIFEKKLIDIESSIKKEFPDKGKGALTKIGGKKQILA